MTRFDIAWRFCATLSSNQWFMCFVSNQTRLKLLNIFNCIMSTKTIEFDVFARTERENTQVTSSMIIASSTTLSESQSYQKFLEQNEIVERLRQIIMSMINIMLKNVDLNDKWWIELIKTINYFRNRSSMIDKSIIFYEIDTKRKFFLAHFRRNWDNRLCYETKIDHEIKKTNSHIIFDCSRELRRESHLLNATSQRNHLSCFVCHLNQEKAFTWRRNRNIVKAINFRIIQFFDEKTSFKVKFDNNSHFDSDLSSKDVVVLVLVINHWNQYVI
jgi:hypothetical protein